MFLVQKGPFLPLFFFRQYRPGKCLLSYSRRRKRLSRLPKEEVIKSRKIDIFPWFLSKNCHFSNVFLLGNIRREKVFYDILERKNAFRGYKSKMLKKSKNSQFSKGLNPWFWSKNGHFFNFFFKAIWARKLSLMIF